jgi:hypothetical protein
MRNVLFSKSRPTLALSDPRNTEYFPVRVAAGDQELAREATPV